jgi:hypothetical protein
MGGEERGRERERERTREHISLTVTALKQTNDPKAGSTSPRVRRNEADFTDKPTQARFNLIAAQVRHDVNHAFDGMGAM